MFSPFPLKPQSSKGKILFQTKSKANPSLHSSIETKDLKGLKNGESSAPPSKSLPTGLLPACPWPLLNPAVGILLTAAVVLVVRHNHPLTLSYVPGVMSAQTPVILEQY